MASPSEAQRIYSGTIDSHGGAVFQGDLNAARDININHITTIRPFAKSLYESFLTSSEFFKQVQNELGALLALLEVSEDNFNKLRVDANHHPHLCTLSQDCHQVLQDLQCMKAHFDSTGTETQLTWERMGWRTDELADIRSRLRSYTGTLNVINSNIMISSQASMKQMLRTFIDEVSTGKREGSVVSTQTTGSLSADQKEEWRQLRRELESVGITPVLFEQHRTFIVATLQKAIREEGLAGDIPDTYNSFDGSDSGQEDLRTLSQPDAISSAQPYVKHRDEPLQQPIQDRNISGKVPTIDIPGRIKNILRNMGLMARPSIKPRFMAALKSGDAILVERLLIEGATVNSVDGTGMTPLAWAARYGWEEVAKLLLNNGAAVDPINNEYGETALSFAAGQGHEAVVKLLLDNGAAVDCLEKSNGSLGGAAAGGFEAVVQLLLSKGAAVDSRSSEGETPLSEAASHGHMAVVKLLLDNGAAADLMDIFCDTPLSGAAANGHQAVVKLLLSKGAAVDSRNWQGKTPLSKAAQNEHETVVKLLLNNGAAANSSDNFGETPLSQAAGNGLEPMVKLLVDNGAAVNTMDKLGLTPLLQAAGKGHEAVVKLLVDNGAAVDSMDNWGRTPLSLAAAKGHEAVVKMLLSDGVTVDSRSSLGDTPLSWATEMRHETLIKLLDKGAGCRHVG